MLNAVTCLANEAHEPGRTAASGRRYRNAGNSAPKQQSMYRGKPDLRQEELVQVGEVGVVLGAHL